MFLIIIVIFCLFAHVEGCVSGSCTSGMCSDIPSTNQYYLTSFCDSSVACGSFSGNCNEYYMADYMRFGCNSIVSCCVGSDCLNLKVIDGGPGCSVEDSAHKQIVDASYSTCKHFTGYNDCGWSDKFVVTCKKTSASFADLDAFDEDGTGTFKGDKQSYVPFEMPSPHGGPFKTRLGPCSYNQTFASLSGRPLCGLDYDVNFEAL